MICKLKEFRKAKGITQVELAKAVGVTRQSITNLETGKYLPSMKLYVKIGNYFGVLSARIFVPEQSDIDGITGMFACKGNVEKYE